MEDRKNINAEIDNMASDPAENTKEAPALTLSAAEHADDKESQKSKKLPKQRKRGWFFMRMAVFVIVMLMILTYAMYVLTPKYAYGICSIMNYYNLPEDSVDVLLCGTSLTYTDVNTNILWSEYGIAAYNLATAEQPYWSTYYYLKEALKTQTPKLILLDAKASTYTETKVDRMRTVLCSYGLLNPISRISCIWECTEVEDFWGYLLAFPQIHTNYYAVTEESFTTPPTNVGRGNTWKGYIEKDAWAEHDAPNIVWSDKEAEINEHELEYLEKTLQLLSESGIETVLICYPNADYKHDHYYYNTASKLAESYGISTINYNLPEKNCILDYSTDCADWQHLNIGGSYKFSMQLGQDLKDNFDLTDHRGDKAYSSYEECASIWYEKYPEYCPWKTY